MRLILIGIALALASGLAQAQQFQEGVHFQRIEGPEMVVQDQVQVTEAFGYPCGACRNFLPFITAWEEAAPDYVQFERLPVPLQQGWELFALGYYTAEVMGLDTHVVHPAVFRAIHDERQRIRSLDDLAGIYAANSDVSAESFVATAGSFAVDSSMRKNRSDLTRFGVRSTPTMIVQGKWRISPNGFNSYEDMLAAVDYLVEREARELGLIDDPADADVIESES